MENTKSAIGIAQLMLYVADQSEAVWIDVGSTAAVLGKDAAAEVVAIVKTSDKFVEGVDHKVEREKVFATKQTLRTALIHYTIKFYDLFVLDAVMAYFTSVESKYVKALNHSRSPRKRMANDMDISSTSSSSACATPPTSPKRPRLSQAPNGVVTVAEVKSTPTELQLTTYNSSAGFKNTPNPMALRLVDPSMLDGLVKRVMKGATNPVIGEFENGDRFMLGWNKCGVSLDRYAIGAPERVSSSSKIEDAEEGIRILKQAKGVYVAGVVTKKIGLYLLGKLDLKVNQ